MCFLEASWLSVIEEPLKFPPFKIPIVSLFTEKKENPIRQANRNQASFTLRIHDGHILLMKNKNLSGSSQNDLLKKVMVSVMPENRCLSLSRLRDTSKAWKDVMLTLKINWHQWNWCNCSVSYYKSAGIHIITDKSFKDWLQPFKRTERAEFWVRVSYPWYLKYPMSLHH